MSRSNWSNVNSFKIKSYPVWVHFCKCSRWHWGIRMCLNTTLCLSKPVQNKGTAVARAAACTGVGLRSLFFSDWLPFLSAVCVKHGAEKKKRKTNSQHAPAGGNTQPITIECVGSSNQWESRERVNSACSLTGWRKRGAWPLVGVSLRVSSVRVNPMNCHPLTRQKVDRVYAAFTECRE